MQSRLRGTSKSQVLSIDQFFKFTAFKAVLDRQFQTTSIHFKTATAAIFAYSIHSPFNTMKRRSTTPGGSGNAVRIGATLALPAVLRSLGFNPAELFAEVGFDLALFDDPDNRLAYAQRNHLFAHCVDRTACDHLGLLVGQQAGLHSLGLVGLLVKYSPTVGAALRSLVRFMHLHVRGAVTNLELDGNAAMLSYEIYQPGAAATNQISDGAIAGLFNVMRTLCGHTWAPSELRFAHRPPADIAPFREFFQAPLEFNSTRNAVVFSSNWLNLVLQEKDQPLHDLLVKQIEALEVEFGDDLPGKVRSILRSALLTDYCSSDRIAALLSMHSRTLHRRLTEFDTTFQQLVDEGRFEIARQMLSNTSMVVGQIADSLGYADASAFTRAFRRWSGTTPAKWRENQTTERNRL